MASRRLILIVGGYGAFGSRAAERLAREADLEIVVAGRSRQRAEAAVGRLAGHAMARVGAAAIDATRPDPAVLSAIAPQVIVNASGPFQGQDLALARAAAEVGAHYVDLADAASFVLAFAGDRSLDRAVRERGLLAVSGASTVPAISGAVLDHLAPAFARLTSLRYGISPGNRFDPGPATAESILSALGMPFGTRRDGAPITVHGWQGLSRHAFPTIGTRWLGYCNVPDLALFAERYPSLDTIDFRAGLEVAPFHLGLWALSWPGRLGLLPGSPRLSRALLAVKRRLAFLGSDAGGMFMRLEGTDVHGSGKVITWQLEALHGHGPYIPTTPAVILARKLARGEIRERGARACLGLVTLPEIERELGDLDITMSTT